jgi:serine protease Do
VTNVDPGSSAAEAGIQQGDVIQEVNHKPVHSTGDFESAVAGMANQPVLLLVNRNGTTHYVVVAPQG